MSTYPQIMGASVQPKQHRMNKIYGTPQVVSARKQLYQTKGPNMFKRIIQGLDQDIVQEIGRIITMEALKS